MPLRQSRQVGPLFKRHSDQVVEEIYSKFAVSGLRWRTVMAFCMLIFATTEFEPSEGGNNQPRLGYT